MSDEYDIIEGMARILYEIDRMPAYHREHLIHLMPESRLLREQADQWAKRRGAPFSQPIR